ncbi:MAG: aromatic ring-hydroxylating oxygenase subunit alpha [Burkholderiales bacterium]
MSELNRYFDDRPDANVFRVHGDAFTNNDLLELEFKNIFEKTWIFIAFESSIAKPNDYVTSRIGRTPVLVARDIKGRVGAFINACRHKGATVARLSQGNARYHVCPYHGWAYDAAGKNVDIKDRKSGCYAAAFDAENHDLIPVAKVAIYKGMVFGSLSAQVPPLDEYLGDYRFFLDLIMDQGKDGMEVIPGQSIYTYRGNWKLQLENPLDSYHVDITHASYIAAVKQRAAANVKSDVNRIDYADRASGEGGIFDFPHGHSVYWRTIDSVAKRPIYPVIDEIRARVGKVRADWMLDLRNTALFPNVLVLDTVVPHIRVVRPLATDLTEVQTYSLAPIGESPDLRAWRMRQLEDFLNPAGLATPDDLDLFDTCQQGFGAAKTWLQGYERGMTAWSAQPDQHAQAIGISPHGTVRGNTQMGSEVGLRSYWREWRRLMEAGMAGKNAY